MWLLTPGPGSAKEHNGTCWACRANSSSFRVARNPPGAVGRMRQSTICRPYGRVESWRTCYRRSKLRCFRQWHSFDRLGSVTGWPSPLSGRNSCTRKQCSSSTCGPSNSLIHSRCVLRGPGAAKRQMNHTCRDTPKILPKKSGDLRPECDDNARPYIVLDEPPQE